MAGPRALPAPSASTRVAAPRPRGWPRGWPHAQRHAAHTGARPDVLNIGTIKRRRGAATQHWAPARGFGAVRWGGARRRSAGALWLVRPATSLYSQPARCRSCATASCASRGSQCEDDDSNLGDKASDDSAACGSKRGRLAGTRHVFYITIRRGLSCGRPPTAASTRLAPRANSCPCAQ